MKFVASFSVPLLSFSRIPPEAREAEGETTETFLIQAGDRRTNYALQGIGEEEEEEGEGAFPAWLSREKHLFRPFLSLFCNPVASGRAMQNSKDTAGRKKMVWTGGKDEIPPELG